MDVGSMPIPCEAHHSPCIVETGPSLIKIPPPTHQGPLNLDSDPLEQVLKLRVGQQINLAVPCTLVGEFQTQGVGIFAVQNSFSPVLELA